MQRLWKRFRTCSVVILILLVVVALAVSETRAIIRGLLRGEPFADDNLPLSYHIERLRNTNPDLIEHSLYKIAHLRKRGRAAIPAIVVLIHDPELWGHAGHFTISKELAVSTLRDIGWGAPEVVPPLIEFLADQDPNVRWAAVDALGKIGPVAAPAVPALVRTIRNDQGAACAASAELLARIDLPALRRAITEFMVDDDPAARIAAISAIESGQQDDLIPLIRTMLHDPDPRVMKAAADSLKDYGIAPDEK